MLEKKRIIRTSLSFRRSTQRTPQQENQFEQRPKWGEGFSLVDILEEEAER